MESSVHLIRRMMPEGPVMTGQKPTGGELPPTEETPTGDEVPRAGKKPAGREIPTFKIRLQAFDHRRMDLSENGKQSLFDPWGEDKVQSRLSKSKVKTGSRDVYRDELLELADTFPDSKQFVAAVFGFERGRLTDDTPNSGQDSRRKRRQYRERTELADAAKGADSDVNRLDGKLVVRAEQVVVDSFNDAVKRVGGTKKEAIAEAIALYRQHHGLD